MQYNWMTVRECAEMLGCTSANIYNKIRRGTFKGKVKKSGTTYLVKYDN